VHPSFNRTYYRKKNGTWLLTEVGGNPGLENDSGLCNEPSPPNEGVLVGNELVVDVDAGNPGKLDVSESEM